MGQLGVAGAQDHIGVGVKAEFLLEGGLDVDLGQGAEPLSPEGVLDPGDRVLNGQVSAYTFTCRWAYGLTCRSA